MTQIRRLRIRDRTQQGLDQCLRISGRTQNQFAYLRQDREINFRSVSTFASRW